MPVGLKTSLKAERYQVRNLLRMATEGTLRVPSFQRPLRWQREDHRLFLDSLFRGYPVGTLLLWKRPAPEALLKFGKWMLEANANPEALWIVDGQQRLTSLIGCLMHPDRADGRRGDEFAFDFDLQKEEFLPSPPSRALWQIPAALLHDPNELVDWCAERGLSKELRNKAVAICNGLLDYEIPAYITQAESDLELRQIFERVNSSGKHMRAGEIFNALNSRSLRSGAADSSEHILDRLGACLQVEGFGTVSPRTLQKCLVAVAGFNPKEDLPPALRKPDAALSYERPTELALTRAVNFLREDCALPHALLLPYELPLIILARFFHRFPEPLERSQLLLSRWVWRGIATQTHETSNQHLGPYSSALKAEDEEDVVQQLLRQVPRRPPNEYPASVTFSLVRNMKTRLELSALFRLEPRDLDSGQHLSPTAIFSPDVPEELAPGTAARPALPRLLSAKNDLDGMHKWVAAHFLHPRLPGGDAEFARRLSGASNEVLCSHGVPDDAFQAVRRQDWPDVILARKEALSCQVKTTIDHFARWDEDDDGPSIEFWGRSADSTQRDLWQVLPDEVSRAETSFGNARGVMS